MISKIPLCFTMAFFLAISIAKSQSTLIFDGKEFKVDAEKVIYEKQGDTWVHIGDRCNRLFTKDKKLFCVSVDGTIWKYKSEAHSWELTNTDSDGIVREMTWGKYLPNLDYNFRGEYKNLKAPTKFLHNPEEELLDSIVLKPSQLPAGVKEPWWCFRMGKNRNPLITEKAWIPMLQRMESDFAYFRDSLGIPPDRRALNGYYSTIDLFGSGLSDKASNTELGGWMSSVYVNDRYWEMVLLSYYPIYCFDPTYRKPDKEFQTGACVHEGLHAVLAAMDGCKQAGWFHEATDNTLMGLAESKRTNKPYINMGFLSMGTMIAPFIPIECGSGWLQDGTFGGPNFEGVNKFDENKQQICTWRNLLGGIAYSEAFPYFLVDYLSKGSLMWIWKYSPNRVLEALAKGNPEKNIQGLGEELTRKLILEFRSRAAFCDFGKRSPAYIKLLDESWGQKIEAEGNVPSGKNLVNNLEPWTSTCYVKTTSDNQPQPTLTPEARTLPGWSGANQIPLLLEEGATSIAIDFKPKEPTANLVCQIVYKSEDGKVHYSAPIEYGKATFQLQGAVKNNMVVLVVCNTDFAYIEKDDYSRKKKFEYNVQLLKGIKETADITQQWYKK